MFKYIKFDEINVMLKKKMVYENKFKLFLFGSFILFNN